MNYELLPSFQSPCHLVSLSPAHPLTRSPAHLVTCHLSPYLCVHQTSPATTHPRSISVMLRHPAKPSVRSKSAIRFARTVWTPALPASARPYAYGRPMHTAVAPSANALNASAPPAQQQDRPGGAPAPGHR